MYQLNKFISIITPSYNQADFIEDAIKSVIAQNYENFEHIIIDGESSDGTLEILKKYKHIHWISEADKGQSDALNKGFRLAHGDIIGWLNADDIYLENAFININKAFISNPLADIIYGEIIFTDRNFKNKRNKYDHKFNRNVLLYYDCIIPSAGAFFSKKIFSEKNYLDINFKASMDYEFFCRLVANNYKFVYIPQPIAYFRKTGINYGQKYESVWNKEILAIKKRYTNLPFKDCRIFSIIIYVVKFPFWIKRILLK